jgi:hypothetical protein
MPDLNSDFNITNPNNNWTKSKEAKLLEWQQQSRLHSLGHSRAQEIFANRNNIMMIPSIIVGAVATLMDGVALLWQDQYMPFVAIALLLTAITTIITGILQATKPVEVAASHEEMAKGYNRIILQIDAMLAKEYTERINGTRFLTKIEEELINLKTGIITIPDTIWIGVKEEFIAGECDFLKMHDDQGYVKLPSSRDTVIDINRKDGMDMDLTANIVTASAPPAIEEHDDLAMVEPMVDISGTAVPRFELNIHNDPKLKKMNKLFYDYQYSRW